MNNKNNILKEEKTLQKFQEYFIYYLFFLVICRSIGPYSLINPRFDQIIFGIGAIYGFLLIATEFILIVLKKKANTYNIWLVIFLVGLFLSIVFNYRFALFSNLKLLVWQAIYLLVVFQIGKDNIQSERIIKNISNLLVLVWTILTTISLGMFVSRFGYAVHLTNRARFLRIGFFDARLFGVFEDPNFSSTVSVVVILLIVYSLKIKKGKMQSFFSYLAILFQLAYIQLSGSRTGLIVLLLSIFVFSFSNILNLNIWIKKKKLYKWLGSLISACIVVIISYVLLEGFKEILSLLPALLFNEEHKILKGIPEKDVGKISLERGDVENNSDVSNGRLGLWKSGFELFKTNILFGTSPKGIFEYAKEVLPTTFIAKTQKYTHNTYVNIITSTGLAGSIPIFFFFIRSFTMVVINAYGKMNLFFKNNFGLNAQIVLAIAASAFFLNDIVMVNSIGSLLFWLFLGRNYHLSKK
ncbi:O-antigen ligase family protein [Enterococcus pseudoavium]|uniref:O-antigen ligase family protein n=1 Tax=Enterococcus pseudoavium TaxID=44007 RepID=A0ABU3FF91_9ENTE|nr:O-antigen ligase family protein [Enterococcus pseudoavium]MDT2769697.1 O-antigen ligase family protein [Enterococcus pseudoavium]